MIMDGFINTPCQLIFYSNGSGKLELASKVDTDKCHLVLGVVCDNVVFALTELGKKALTDFKLLDPHLMPIEPDDVPKAVSAAHKTLLEKTVLMLSFHCKVDNNVIKKPLFLWK